MSANSLEHYGVKGMKWDESKRKKTQKDYTSTSFWDISPVELPAWRKAQRDKKKKIDAPKSSYIPPPMPKKKSSLQDSIAKAKRKLGEIKKVLYKFGGKSIGTISSQTTSVGKSAINGVLKSLQKKSR